MFCRKETVVNVCGFLNNSCFSVCGFLDKEWSRDEGREAKNTTNIGSNQGSGLPPVLVKAEVSWSAKRGALSDKDRVLKSMKGYC
ncbi:Eukaryotic translation initiation factor isoform 4G-2 [Cardamine amara subsp. amara]|uniref:Eukaryotic translation initiation factor isoform 4G-2 n=1 Tax=Cardamine amara subsp. amara TaxID=228776 RepID=A0ABD0ZXB0_CARAN